MKANCPACGAGIEFRSGASIFQVCSYCRSMLVRHDVKIEDLGKMADLPGDMSVIQLGTRGVYDGRPFEVIGRLKVGWAEGQWDEWHVLFPGAGEAWLASAQGYYAMSFREPPPAKLPAPSSLKVGDRVDLGKGRLYEVQDARKAQCLGSEGELPFVCPKGREVFCVDLGGPRDAFATLEAAERETRVYVGKFVELESLAPANLRKHDGW